MRFLTLLAILLCAVFPLQGQVTKNSFNVHRPATRTSSATNDLSSDHFFRPVLTNERVSVFEVEIPPHQGSGSDLHKHDYILISLGPSHFEVANATNTYPFQMGDGEMEVLSGGWSQRISNLSETPLRLIEIDVARNIHPEHPICGLAAQECTDGQFGKTDEGSWTQSTLFATDTVKLSRVLLSGRGTLPPHSHDRSHVLIALDELQLSDDTADGASKEIKLHPGEAFWYASAVAHSLSNMQDRDARFLTMDVK